MYYEIPVPPKPEKMGKDIFKTIGLQCGIFLLHQSALYFLILKMHRYEFGFLEMAVVCLHWLLLLILTIVFFATGKTGKGIGYVISFFILLVIGFGSCTNIFLGNHDTVPEDSSYRIQHDSLEQDSILKSQEKSLDSVSVKSNT